MKRPAVFRSLAALSAAVAAPAHAHLVETGFGDFYDGVAHFAVTPSDLLVVVALALLAGQRGSGAARYALFALPLAWMAGILVGAYWPATAASPLLTTLSFALAGALVALNMKLRDAGVAVFAAAAGLLHGLVDGATMTPGSVSGPALSGVIGAVVFLTGILSAQVVALPAGWPRIVVRVAGSWIAATGMLMFGWLVHAAA